MNNILQLFTYFKNLTFTPKETNDEQIELFEASYTLRSGENIQLFHSLDHEEEEESWIIAGGYIFKEFQTLPAAERFFMNLQKKPELLFSPEIEDFNL